MSGGWTTYGFSNTNSNRNVRSNLHLRQLGVRMAPCDPLVWDEASLPHALVEPAESNWSTITPNYRHVVSTILFDENFPTTSCTKRKQVNFKKSTLTHRNLEPGNSTKTPRLLKRSCGNSATILSNSSTGIVYLHRRLVPSEGPTELVVVGTTTSHHPQLFSENYLFKTEKQAFYQQIVAFLLSLLHHLSG